MRVRKQAQSLSKECHQLTERFALLAAIVGPIVLEYSDSAVLKPDPVEILQTAFIERISLDIIEDVSNVWLWNQRQATIGVERFQLERRRTASAPCCLQ